jgi:hypothetical protein
MKQMERIDANAEEEAEEEEECTVSNGLTR